MKPISRVICRIGTSTVKKNRHLQNLRPDELIQKLLIHEELIIEGSRLGMIPEIMKVFGYADTLELLKSGLVRFKVYVSVFADTTGLKFRDERSFLKFSLGQLLDGNYEHNLGRDIEDMWTSLKDSHLSSHEKSRLEDAVIDAILPPLLDLGKETFDYVKTDLQRPKVLNTFIKFKAMKDFGCVVDDHKLKIVVHQVDDKGKFEVEANLQQLLRIPRDREHKFIERIVLGIGGMHQKLEVMQKHEAIISSRDDEFPLLENRMTHIFSQIDPGKDEVAFAKVIRICDFPTFSKTGVASLSRILELRETPTWKTFRDSIHLLKDYDESQIIQTVKDLRSSIGIGLESSKGQIIRFVVGQVAGLAFPSVSAPPMSALDAFLLEKVFVAPGQPLAFLMKDYPTIFQSKEK